LHLGQHVVLGQAFDGGDFLPTAALTGTTQERIGAPSICTVQAPHCAMPQPYLVPVRPICSRIAHSSGVADRHRRREFYR